MFVFFTFFFVFALFNILTGIFVEKSVVAAVPDRDELILEQSKKAKMEAEEFRQLCVKLDDSNTGLISLAEFMLCMEDEHMVSYMATVGLEVHDVELFFKIVASGASSVAIDRFVEGCMSMKGNASGLDMQKQLFETCSMFEALKSFRSTCEDRIDSLTAKVEEGMQDLADLVEDVLPQRSLVRQRPDSNPRKEDLEVRQLVKATDELENADL
jgi:hypothetical protein